MSFFASFPAFMCQAKKVYFSSQHEELLNEQTLASNEMQACLQNGGKRRGNFPGALKCFSSFFAASFRTTNDLPWAAARRDAIY